MNVLIGRIPMRVTRLVSHQTDAVYSADGRDYLATRHRVTLECLLGLGAERFVAIPNSFLQGPQPIIPTYPVTGVTSVAAARHMLSQSNQPFLLWTVNNLTLQPDVLLFSDGVDVMGGPRVIEPPSVQAIHGDGNLCFVRLCVELNLNECPNSPDGLVSRPNPYRMPLLTLDGRPALLSNRYTQYTEYSREDESVRYVIEGEAIFRADTIARLGIGSVDQFRGALVPGTVVNCVRRIEQLALSSDGLTLAYRVVDEEPGPRNYLDVPHDAAGNILPPLRDPDPRKPAQRQRNVERVDLTVTRTHLQPAIGKALFEVIDDLVQVNFALPEEGQGAGGGDPRIAAAKAAADAIKRKRNLAFAALKTVDRSVVPTSVESATAFAQINRHGKLEDAKALCFSLISGGLRYGVADLGQGDRFRQNTRFFALPPAAEYTLQWNPVAGWVTASMTFTRSGLVDFLVGGQQNAQASLLAPLDDEVKAGVIPLSVLSLPDIVGFINLNTLLSWDVAAMKKLLSGKVAAWRYADQLLVTNRDAYLRGPSGDGWSRGASDLLVRAAALLLSPCEQPQPPGNSYLTPLLPPNAVAPPPAVPPTPPPPPPTPPGGRVITTTAAEFTSVAKSRKTQSELLAEWGRQIGE